jgi:hypothetical protein
MSQFVVEYFSSETFQSVENFRRSIVQYNAFDEIKEMLPAI